MTETPLRLGVAGLGRAFTIMMPAFANPKLKIVAAADPRPEARRRFGADFSAATYPTVEEMCGDPAVEAIYVATPHQHHKDNVLTAASHGKHVLVEKPLALTIADCQAMIAAADAAKIVMVVGHSHSFDLPIRRVRALIDDGGFGQLRMITAAYYTDFLYRPRRAEELNTASGGGVMFNQAPHQVDVVRMIGGGKVTSVRAHVGDWDPARSTEGAYQALLSFENGASASLTYSGYAHFDGDEFNAWIAESGLPKDPKRYGVARAALTGISTRDDEEQLKHRVNYGGAGYSGPTPERAGPRGDRAHQHFGLILASCTHADLRPTSKGIHIYADTERRFDPLPAPKVFRDEVVDEFYQAVVDGAPVVHSGRWSLATMEVCLAMLQSHREAREIKLQHQVGLETSRHP